MTLGALIAAGATGEHVVKVNVYLTDINDRGLISPARQRYFGEQPPASILVGVAAPGSACPEGGDGGTTPG